LRAIATVATLLPRRAWMRCPNARNGPGERLQAQAASTRIRRASAEPSFEMRPMRAGVEPDWRTRASSPR
jgi:hypothetical protein